jgi:hypothetical protein
MQTKLTLRIDERLIAKGKREAAKRGMSLSQLISELLKVISDPEENWESELTPWTRSLMGVLEGEYTQKSDEEIREEYISYLEDKYR